MVPHMISGDGNVALILNGKQFYIQKEDDVRERVLGMLSEGATAEDILTVIDRATPVADYLEDSDVKVVDGVLTYCGEEVHNSLTERIITFMKEGLPVQPLINFLKRLMENPSFSARNELFDFLDHRSLPITEDGHFLAYKSVNYNYKDKYSGKITNKVGETVTMARYGVDDDRGNGCGSGLHAGTLAYVQSYGSFHDEDDSDRVVIVKIDPEHVVSVPKDCDCQKLRCCEYVVLRDYEGEMQHNLYTDEGDEWEDDDTDEMHGSYEIDFYNWN